MSGATAQGYTAAEQATFQLLLTEELAFLKGARDGNWHSSVQAAKEGRSERRDVHAKARMMLSRTPAPVDMRELMFERYLGWLRATGYDARFNRYR